MNLHGIHGPITTMKTGIELIAAERERQITSEGYTASHDNQYGDNELLEAANSYIRATANGWDDMPCAWPFSEEWWKPSGPIRNLVKAGALIAAEIDRIQREEIES